MMAAKIVVVATSGSKTGQIEFYSTHVYIKLFLQTDYNKTPPPTHPPSHPTYLADSARAA